MLIASDYEQPFGTFTAALPMAGEIRGPRRDGTARGASVKAAADAAGEARGGAARRAAAGEARGAAGTRG